MTETTVTDMEWIMAFIFKFEEVIDHIESGEYKEAEQCASRYKDHLTSLLETDKTGMH